MADAELEKDLEKAEREPRSDREPEPFEQTPGGVGPTLGQDLGKPNPGHDIVWDDEDEEDLISK